MKCGRPGCGGTLEDVGAGAVRTADSCGLAPVAAGRPDRCSECRRARLRRAASAACRRGGVSVRRRSAAGSPPQPAAAPAVHRPARRRGRPARCRSARSAYRRRRPAVRTVLRAPPPAAVRGPPRRRAGRSPGGCRGADRHRESGRSVSVRSIAAAAAATSRGNAGRGPGDGAGGAAGRSAGRGAGEPRGARAQALVQQQRVRRAGGPLAAATGPGRTEGYCTKCGHPYSFTPKLRAGDVVHGQYEVVGCLAHGGLGWIYLAIDRAVSDRWVVLKGLLDTGDEDALAAALVRAALPRRDRAPQHRADLQLRRAPRPAHRHPRRLHRHGVHRRQVPQGHRQRAARPATAAGAAAGGAGRRVRASRRWTRSATCTAAGCCTATSRWTTRSRPRTSSKLIDLGAVRRMDDVASAIYGTVGYQAPEVAEVGPVGRLRPVHGRPHAGRADLRLPGLHQRLRRQPAGPASNIEVFARYESFYRLLVRATDPDPASGSPPPQEMADQLTGVLREIVALQTGRPRPALSTLFGPELRVVDTELVAPAAADTSALGADWAQERERRRQSRRGARPRGARKDAQGARRRRLPGGGSGRAAGRAARHAGQRTRAAGLPAPAAGGRPPGRLPAGPAPPCSRCRCRTWTPSDPNAGFLAGLIAAAPGRGAGRAGQSAPARLGGTAAARAAGPAGARRPRRRAQALRRAGADHAGDWRVVWYRGLAALCRTATTRTAALSLRRGLRRVPRRVRAQAGAGMCAEVLGQSDNAAEYYRLVWTTDQTLRQRRVRPGPGAAGGRRPGRRGAGPGVGAGGVDPLHRRVGRRGAGPAAGPRAAGAAARPT